MAEQQSGSHIGVLLRDCQSMPKVGHQTLLYRRSCVIGYKWLNIFLHVDQEFLMRQKMVNVDVDSRGRKCKERLLNILCEERLPGQAERLVFLSVCLKISQLSLCIH